MKRRRTRSAPGCGGGFQSRECSEARGRGRVGRLGGNGTMSEDSPQQADLPLPFPDLAALGVDAATREAFADWRCWTAMGYEL